MGHSKIKMSVFFIFMKMKKEILAPLFVQVRR